MGASGSALAKSKFRDHEVAYRALRAARKYPAARSELDAMIEIVRGDPASFDEPDDRIGILRARKATVTYKEERLSGGGKLWALLREAADHSRPSYCRDRVCNPAEDGAACFAQISLPSARQSRMCVERLSYITDALKLEASAAAHSFDYPQALAKRRLASVMHRSVLLIDNSPNRVSHQTYLDYWWEVTDGYVSLLKGEFQGARQMFTKALETARQLNEKRCFPNYFRSRAEIAAHQYFIDAVESVSTGHFLEARSKLLAWLDTNTDKRPSIRTENIEILAAMCDILARLRMEDIPLLDWTNLNRLLERRYTARPTWALWRKLQWLRELAFRARRTKEGTATAVRLMLNNELDNIKTDWRLFVPDTVLLGDDRLAGLVRRVNYLSLFDIGKSIHAHPQYWPALLLQNLRHMLLLMTDYERMRNLDPPPGETPKTVPTLIEAPEKMSCRELFDAVLRYLEARSTSHASVFAGAEKHLDRCLLAIDNSQMAQALSAQDAFFEAIRFWPHVIMVMEQSDLPEAVFMDEESPNFLAYVTRARRLWQENPSEIVFEGPQQLAPGCYYYLRPRWNVRKGERYRLRHERFHESKLPRWISTHVESLAGRGKASASKYIEWILQFPENERLLACRLLSALVIYDDKAVRGLWTSVFQGLPREAKRDGVFIGLGHGAKSGRLNPYSFRQGIAQLPEYDVLFGGREMKVFRDMAEFEKKELGLQKPRVIVFLDDFIGVGGQVVDFVHWYFSKYPWLREVQVFLGILVGFRTAIEQRVAEGLRGKVQNIIVGKYLEESDRAFSAGNAIWDSTGEARGAEKWAEQIGRQILAGKAPYEPNRDALGWHGCQALIAFDYNVPSDTLPLFWADGKFENRTWKPLLQRFD